MNSHLLLGKIACLAFLTTNLLPAFGQSQPTRFHIAAANDTATILNIVRGWGTVQDILIINKYATLSYAYGQNGGNVTFQHKNGRWIIIDGVRAGGYCQEINCLVNKGVPRNIATKFFNYLQNSNRTKTRELNSFRKAWSKKNSNIAPFLGYWRDMKSIAISVWPSTIRNRVCLVGISENYQYVKVGIVSGRNIKTDNQIFTVSQDQEYGDSLFSSDHNNDLVNPSTLNTWYFNATTRKKLRDSGCTNSLPNG